MRRKITEHAASKSAEVSIARPPPKAEGILVGHEPTLSPNASAADIYLLFNFSDRIALDWVIDDLIHARATFVDGAPENQFCEVIPVTLPFMTSPCPDDDRKSFEGQTVQVGMRTLDIGIRVVAVAERIFNTLSDLVNSRLIAPGRSGTNAAIGHCNRDRNDHRCPGIV